MQGGLPGIKRVRVNVWSLLDSDWRQSLPPHLATAGVGSGRNGILSTCSRWHSQFLVAMFYVLLPVVEPFPPHHLAYSWVCTITSKIKLATIDRFLNFALPHLKNKHFLFEICTYQFVLKIDSLAAFRNRKEQFVQLLAVHRIDTLVLLSINLGRQFTGQRVNHSGPYWDGILKHRLLQTYSSQCLSTTHTPGPARLVRPVRFWPYHYPSYIMADWHYRITWYSWGHACMARGMLTARHKVSCRLWSRR